MLMSIFFWKKWFPLRKMLFYVLRQIIQQNRKETGNDQEVQRRRKAGGNQCRQSRSKHCSNFSTNRSRSNNGKSMVEKCRMARLRGIKSRVQFSDNPATIVQQQKNWFFVDFSKSVDHGIPIQIFQTAFCWKNKNGISGRVQNSVYTAFFLKKLK